MPCKCTRPRCPCNTPLQCGGSPVPHRVSKHPPPSRVSCSTSPHPPPSTARRRVKSAGYRRPNQYHRQAAPHTVARSRPHRHFKGHEADDAPLTPLSATLSTQTPEPPNDEASYRQLMLLLRQAQIDKSVLQDQVAKLQANLALVRWALAPAPSAAFLARSHPTMLAATGRVSHCGSRGARTAIGGGGSGSCVSGPDDGAAGVSASCTRRGTSESLSTPRSQATCQ